MNIYIYIQSHPRRSMSYSPRYVLAFSMHNKDWSLWYGGGGWVVGWRMWSITMHHQCGSIWASSMWIVMCMYKYTHTQEGLESCNMCLEIIVVHGWTMWAMWQHIHDAESVKPYNTWPTMDSMQACVHTGQLIHTCMCVLFDFLNQSGKLHVACMWYGA